MTTSKGTALVTGASRGIGAIYADRLARRGYDLILTARGTAALEAVAARLRHDTGRSVAVVPADLANRADVARVEARLRDDASITVLVNNAGVAALTPLLDTPVDQAEALIEINVRALTRLAYAAASAFAGRGTGTIINMASAVAVVPERLNGVYGATKAYVLALSQSMHHELAAKGLRIQAVLPAATATDLWKDSGLPWEELPAETVMTAADMVDAAFAGLDAGEVVTLPSLHDGDEWTRLDALRRAVGGQLSQAQPAPRYRAALAR